MSERMRSAVSHQEHSTREILVPQETCLLSVLTYSYHTGSPVRTGRSLFALCGYTDGLFPPQVFCQLTSSGTSLSFLWLSLLQTEQARPGLTALSDGHRLRATK